MRIECTDVLRTAWAFEKVLVGIAIFKNLYKLDFHLKSLYMELGDSYYQIFQEKIKVSIESLSETISNPTKVQSLENGIALYLKNFPNSELSNLLVASQVVDGKELFAFAYWIPNNLGTQTFNLLQILKQFAEHFGCRIKISEQEGTFIEKGEKIIEGVFQSPFQVVEILESEEIPCETYVFYNETYNPPLNFITTYYSFCINNNLYYLWLYSLPTTTVKVQTKWFKYLKDVCKALNPYGKTKLLVHKPANQDQNVSFTEVTNTGNPSFQEIDLEIPIYYKKPFEYINEVISDLKPNQKLAIIAKTERDRCVFCNSETISQEHIFPIWLRPFFQDKVMDYHLYFQLPDESLESFNSSGTKKNKETLYGLTTYRVCITCNNGWMSNLEDKVKAILVNQEGNLIDDLNLLNSDEINSQLLAKWLCIKALLLSVRNGLIPKIPVNTFLQLRQGIIPEHFIIEVDNFDFYDFDYELSSGVPNDERFVQIKSIDRNTANELAKSFFKASILLGKLAFRISYFNEITALERHRYIRETKIVYPLLYNLPIVKGETEEIWKTLENIIKLKIFNLIGLQLKEAL